ncbi:MAG: hypothetical protein AAF571_01575, partial [Verrucomicrobiota bacterium]
MKNRQYTLAGLLTLAASLNLYLKAAEPITLEIQPFVELQLKAGSHSINSVDRERYFRTYHIPGMFADEQAKIMQELRVSPGRGTGPYFAHNAGDTERAGWDPAFKRQLQKYVKIYRRADERYPGVIHAQAGGNYIKSKSNAPETVNNTVDPDTPSVDATMLVDYKSSYLPKDYAKTTAQVVDWISAIKAGGANPPKYFSPLNEPDAHWKGTPNPPKDHGQFARAIALGLKDRHPEALISGPSSAWGHPRADWKRWIESGWEREFIEQVGDVAGAYDIHVYSKEYWAGSAEHSVNFAADKKQPTPSMYDAF